MQDALIGFRTEITQLDGRKIVIERDTITWPGAKIRKKGEGMANYENNNLHGNLIVTIDIQFPKNNISNQDKEGTYIFLIILIVSLLSYDTLSLNIGLNIILFMESFFKINISLVYYLDLQRILNQSSINKLYNGLNGY